jgi:hypothetical protein
MNKTGLPILIALLLATSVTYASDEVHTWHVISTKAGTWAGRLQAINEKIKFVKPDLSAVSAFNISPNQPLKFGSVFDPNDDFNVAYTLTLTQQSITAFSNKSCVFVVTAQGPADPDVRFFSYNGATCSTTTVPGVGEDFYVS